MGPPVRRVVARLDMYRKVPADLMEGTKQGSLLSLLALATIITLVVLETKQFLTTRIVTDLALDSGLGNNFLHNQPKKKESKLAINFNITMLDLQCEWAVVDVMTSLGMIQTVRSNIQKWPLDANGVKQNTRYKNRHQQDIQSSYYSDKANNPKKTLQEVYASHKQHEIPLDDESLAMAQDDYAYVFVTFFDPLSTHSQDLLPTWGALAHVVMQKDDERSFDPNKPHWHKDLSEAHEMAKNITKPVVIGTVDCREHKDLCSRENIRSYPTVRLYIDGMSLRGNYFGNRTLLAFVDYLVSIEEDYEKNPDPWLHLAHEANMKHDWMSKEDEEARQLDYDKHVKKEQDRLASKETYSQHTGKYPGCQLVGSIFVDRTPGHFYIRARSPNQDFVAHMTNTSHMVHSLTVGDPIVMHNLRIIEKQKLKNHLPDDATNSILNKIAPMNGNIYTTFGWHESYHHYLKLVATTTLDNLHVYQILGNSELAAYTEEEIPEAKFVYDLSPIAISYRATSRHWYDYCTSIMAIVGGVFTVMGMIDSGIQRTVTAVRRADSQRRAMTKSGR